MGDFLEWLYNVFIAVPDILLIFAFAAVLGRGVDTVVLILGLTGWTGLYRQVRAEFIKHSGRDYVRAAEAIGASTSSRMFRHILPNVSHVILVRMSLLVVGFIKSEVILSYLGLGVPIDRVSWGTMLAEAQGELILGLTGWTGLYRQVRAEFIKHRGREYVRAAEAIGASTSSRMFRHILPNVSHVILVRMSLLVVGFIKSEVILSYLGLGVPIDQVSWGTMLAEAQGELILGHWWQLATATAFMALFVTAFSLMADGWRDALDPKLRGAKT